ALEHGFAIRCAVIEGWTSAAVDVPADIAAVEARLRARSPTKSDDAQRGKAEQSVGSREGVSPTKSDDAQRGKAERSVGSREGVSPTKSDDAQRGNAERRRAPAKDRA